MFIKVFVVALLVTVVWCFGPTRVNAQSLKESRQKPQPRAALYACPMHPEVKSSKRGRRCPKCGMALRLVEDRVDATPAPTNNFPTPETDPPSFSSSRIPDVRVYDQNGKQINFYSDLVKGKTVAINFIFTTCTTICPPLTATFGRVQQDLKANALEAQLISVSVDPTTDTPERLRDFAAKYKAGHKKSRRQPLISPQNIKELFCRSFNIYSTPSITLTTFF